MEHCETTELLRARNIRVTRRKTEILRKILACSHPLSAAELHERVSGVLPLDLATVYRTLTMLHQKGILREVPDGSGTVRYEIACVHNPVHPHFRCLRCRKLTCLDALSGEDTAVVAKFAGNRDIEEICITLSGICGECKKEIES